MAAVTASLCWILLFFGVFVFVSADQKTITADPGENVTLTCRAPNDKIITVLEWSRADLGSEYVLLYRDENFDPANQHPSFKNRVDLQDRQMKDGNVSVILKDVTTDDEGTYECRVFMREIHSWELSLIYLRVVLPEHKNITADPGQDVTLTCRAPNNNKPIMSVRWREANLDNGYVLLYQNKSFIPDYQHPSFKNRVDLQDRQMKDGDVSLILKNVTINDTGMYECCIKMTETHSWKYIMVFNLSVAHLGQPGGTSENRGKEDGSVGQKAAVGVVAVILVAAVLGCFYWKNKTKPGSQTPAHHSLLHQGSCELEDQNSSREPPEDCSTDETESSL